jgi:hypothetical protein
MGIGQFPTRFPVGTRTNVAGSPPTGFWRGRGKIRTERTAGSRPLDVGRTNLETINPRRDVPMTKLLRITAVSVATVMFAVVPFTIAGCDQDREIMEVETPEGEVEVEEDVDTGALEIEED